MKKCLVFMIILSLVIMTAGCNTFPNSVQKRPIKDKVLIKSNANSNVKQVAKKAVIVYITRTGKKYHRRNCRYVKKSRIPIKLSLAKKRGYKPCKICKPPR